MIEYEALDAYLEKAFFEPYAQRARDAALEEAAKVCEILVSRAESGTREDRYHETADACAASIRALKTAAAPEQ